MNTCIFCFRTCDTGRICLGCKHTGTTFGSILLWLCGDPVSWRISGRVTWSKACVWNDYLLIRSSVVTYPSGSQMECTCFVGLKSHNGTGSGLLQFSMMTAQQSCEFQMYMIPHVRHIRINSYPANDFNISKSLLNDLIDFN